MSVSAKDLLAQAAQKLAAHKPTPLANEVTGEAVPEPKPAEMREGKNIEARERRAKKEEKAKKEAISEGHTIKKGITLRPGNLQKLDELELSLRKQGVKANHSGLIQVAVDLLKDGPELLEAYRALMKQDLRFKVE